MRKLIYAAVAFVLVGLASAPLKADPISLDQWYTFGFGDAVGSPLDNCPGCTLGTNPPSLLAPDAPWTFTTSGPVQLIVSDGFLSGDQFSLFDFGLLLGATSAPTAGSDCEDDISACLADDSFSHGTFLLGAGDHSITGTVLAALAGGGAGFFQVASVSVPEPVSLGLFGIGIAGLVVMRRKRGTA